MEIESAKFLGLEIGSWSDVMSSLLSGIAIIMTVWQSKIRIKMKYEYDGLNLTLTIINKSQASIKLDSAFANFYTKFIEDEPVAQHTNPIIPSSQDGPYILMPNDSFTTTFQPWNKQTEKFTKIYSKFGFVYYGNRLKTFKLRRKLTKNF